MFNPLNVRAEMARHRVTLAELSSRSGIAVSTLSMHLKEDGNPPVRNLERMAKALGVPVTTFFDCDLRDTVNTAV